MARDSSVGRERILLVPGSLALDGSAQQQQQPVQADINHQIMEVSSFVVVVTPVVVESI